MSKQTAPVDVPPPLRLSDDYRDSRSWDRAAPPPKGPPAEIRDHPADRHGFLIRLDDSDTTHVVRVLTREGRYHASCSCPAECRDCAHVLALVRRAPQLEHTPHEVAWGPGGEGR